MVKAYLKYEPASSFGVIAGSTAPALVLPPVGRATWVAAPAVDAVCVWNMRAASLVACLRNKDTIRAGHVTALALSQDGHTLAAGYHDGSIRLWPVHPSSLLHRSNTTNNIPPTFSSSSSSSSHHHQDHDHDQDTTPYAPQQPIATFNGHRAAISALCFTQTPETPQQQQQSPHTHITSTPSKQQNFPPTTLPLPAPSPPPTPAPSAPRLASGSNDGDLILWDLSAHVGLFRINAHADQVTALLLLDGILAPILISTSKDALLKVYDTASQHCVQTVVGHHAEIWSAAVDPFHNFLFTGSVDSQIRVFRFNPRHPSCPVIHIGNDAPAYDYNATNHHHEQNVPIVETVLDELGSVRRAHAGSRVVHMNVCRYRHQSFLAVCSVENAAEIFRVRTLTMAEQQRKRRISRKSLKAKKAGVDALSALDPPEQTEATIIGSDVISSLRAFRTSFKPRAVAVVSGAHVPSASTRAGSMDILMMIHLNWNSLELSSLRVLTKGLKMKNIGAHGSSGDRTNDVGSAQNQNDLWESEEDDSSDEKESLGEITRVAVVEQHGHRGDVRCIAVSPDDKSLLSVGRNSTKLWNMATGFCIRSIETSGHSVSSCFLDPNGQFAAVGSKEGVLELVDLGSGEILSSVAEAHRDSIWSITVDDEIYNVKYLVTGSADKFVRFWDIRDFLVTQGLETELAATRSLELPDEVLCVRVAYRRQKPLLLVSLMDSTVRAFDMSSLEPYMTFYGHKMPVLSFDVSSDGEMLATGSADKSIKVWGMDFGDCRRSLRAHDESVLSVVFQPGTHYFFSGSRDGSLKYWDGDKFEYISSLEGQSGEVWSVATSLDGEFVASASRDKLFRVWRRTDEQMFLEEEQDRRMDEMFESSLIDDDVREARLARNSNMGALDDPAKGEAETAGKRSMDTIKAGERLIEALQLAEEDRRRLVEDPGELANPLMLGLGPDEFVLRSLENIKSPELEEALSVLALDQAIVLLEYCSRLLGKSNQVAQLCVELLCRTSLFLIRTHHNQIVAGAADRRLVSLLRENLHDRVGELRARYGFNASGLSFWQAELSERQDATFRDASARAFNLRKVKLAKLKRAQS